jgi:dTDP-4-amino-4,6-dideoxygalactose transaminase
MKRRVVESLRERGIGLQVHYFPIHLQPYYCQQGFRMGQYPIAEEFYLRELSIPLYPAMTDQDVDWVVENLRQVFEGLD